MYPRVKRLRDDKSNDIELNFFTKNQGIQFNLENCVGCGTCTKVCPNGVISDPNLEGKIRVKTVDLIPDIPDANACSYCGTCAYMCPFSAITLKKDGNPVGLDNLDIVVKKVVPKLDYKMVNCNKINRQAKVYVEGNIVVDWNKCISCMSCEEVCPTGAFFKSDKERTNDQGKKLKTDLDASKCISCGTCVNACSKSAITLTIDKVNYSGEYKEVFWPDLINRLKS